MFSSFTSNNEDTYTLTVEVENLRNSRGIVQFTLYNKEGSIPDEHYKNYYKMEKAIITIEKSTATFLSLPKGKYAISILHDENNNGKVDKGLLVPKEGIGFSNYQSIGLTNKPRFSKAGFFLHKDMNIVIKMIYM